MVKSELAFGRECVVDSAHSHGLFKIILYLALSFFSFIDTVLFIIKNYHDLVVERGMSWKVDQKDYRRTSSDLTDRVVPDR